MCVCNLLRESFQRLALLLRELVLGETLRCHVAALRLLTLRFLRSATLSLFFIFW